MSAKSTKGLTVHMTKAGVTPASMAVTAISSASPAIATVADTSGMLTGDVALFPASGFTELDNKAFIIGVIDATTFEILGADLVDTVGTIDVGATVAHYSSSDMVLICLSALTLNVTEPGTVSTGTYCDPTTSIPSSVVEAGTLSLAGFVDITSEDYQELLLAEDDGVQRIIRVTLPSNGYLIAPMTVSLITWDLPLDGAIGYTGTGVLGSKLRHVYS